MDTGSGKTMIAVARIKAELEICSADKVRDTAKTDSSPIFLLMHLLQIAWFLAPTVTLVSQQHQVLAENLPAYQTRSLTGADGVDHWSEQSIWDEVLSNIRIVASTHKVVANDCPFLQTRLTDELGSLRCPRAWFCSNEPIGAAGLR